MTWAVPSRPTRTCSPTTRRNPEAKLGLAQAELLQRVQGLDPQAVRKEAAENPADVPAQIRAADLDLVGGHVEDAFGRLVDAVKRTAGDDREAARLRLLELFEVIGADDPRVTAARTGAGPGAVLIHRRLHARSVSRPREICRQTEQRPRFTKTW